ncbi:MAG: sigma-70 family RNA polymerase sigma factor [Acaryochloridaceae cyanobacterium RU_4_10]|nr:sigma-70 family RNA polymerase sigma factor [Acaryochloridaceae cyanobacterium RU_4_10]
MAYKTSTQSQTIELLMAYRRNPSVHLRNRLVKLNFNLVRKVAHRAAYQSSEPYEDLEQCGSLGLILAIERFDPSHGYAFSSFAVPYIRGEILHFLRDHGNAVRIPRHMQKLSREGEKVCQELTLKLGRQPNDVEIAAELKIGLDVWRAVKLSSLNRMLRSLDACLSSSSAQQEDSSLTLGDTLMDLRTHIQQVNAEDSLALQHALSQLDETTREMIESVFLHQQSRRDVAARIGVSPITVTRRVKKGIEELANLLQQQSLAIAMER